MNLSSTFSLCFKTQDKAHYCHQEAKGRNACAEHWIVGMLCLRIYAYTLSASQLLKETLTQFGLGLCLLDVN